MTPYLRNKAQWVIVQLIPKVDKPGKTDKIPFDRMGYPVDAQNPTAWSSYDHAVHAMHAFNQAPNAPGCSWTVGFVLTEHDDLFCLDIDNALLPNGEWSDLAKSLISMLPGCMVEISQSGRGLHIWGRFPNPPPHRKKRTDLGIELYTEKRFIAIGTQQTNDIAERCDALPVVIERMFKPEELATGLPDEGPRADWRGPADDDELLRRAMRSQSAGAVFGDKASFADLFTNDVAVLAKAYPGDSDDGTDRSSVDAALFQHLAFWTGCDQARMLRLAEGSQLVRDKWEREDYIKRTIASACSRQKNVLQDKPPPPGPSQDPGDSPPAPSLDPVDIFQAVAAPVLDPANFPAVLRDYAAARAAAAGHDPGAYLMAGLAAAAGAADDRLRIMLDVDTSWFESPRLWVLLVGSPGAAKTPAIRAAMTPLFDLHRELRARHAREVALLGKDDDPPPTPALYTNDPTLEALTDVLRANERGVMAVYEELDSWLGAHDAYRSNGGSKDRGDWLRLYDGGPHQVDRIKRGSVFVPNWGVSLLGATTPAGLKRHTRDLPPDGLIQRFLPVMVRPMVEPDADPDIRATIKPAQDRFEARLRELVDAGGGTVRLTPGAARVFFERRTALRSETEAVAGVSAPFAGHIAKHAGMLARVALVQHALEHGAQAVDVPLAEETMLRTVSLMGSLTRHAWALFEMLGSGDGTVITLARAIARSIVADKANGVTRHHLTQHCRAFRDADEGPREAALRLLGDAGWVVPIEEGRRYCGRHTSFIVPASVHERFAEEGHAARTRRAAVRELISD